MPNWCWNHLEVSGDEIQLREFVEKSTTNIERDDEFSFNGTYPMPNEFNGIKTGGININGKSCNKWRVIDGKTIEVTEKELSILEEKYGADNWYDWSCKNWGTKWDACESNICHNDIDYFAVSFESAWSPPVNWINNIMQDFPGLCFTLEYEESGMGYGGILSAQHDKIWEDLTWDIESASECCEGEVNWEHEEMDQQCLICGEETETISMNVADIKPAKIKVDEANEN